MMEDLARWLGAQFDEDERITRAATQGDWVWSREFVTPPGYHHRTVGPLEPGDAAYIAEHAPARVLREIDVKRQWLEALIGEGHAALRPGGSTQVYCGADYGTGEPCDCGRDERVSRYLRLLALPYADRPGYRKDWRP